MDAITSPRVTHNPDALIHAHHALMRGIVDPKNLPPRLAFPITTGKIEDVETYIDNMQNLILAWAEAMGNHMNGHAYEVHPNTLANGMSDAFSDFGGQLIEAESAYRRGEYA